MKIFPAVDIRGGKAVRLTQGDYDKMTVYGDDPYSVACGFKEAGAECVHTVDLDGALSGKPENAAIISRIASLGLELEVGGGIRDRERIEMYLQAGAKRIILGTVAAENPAFVTECVKAYGSAIAVGVDARDGKVAVRGWKETTDKDAFDFCTFLRDAGVGAVIYTDISRDGKLQGMNLDAYERLVRIEGLKVIASGGLTRVDEIAALRSMNAYGAILGKAMYDGVLPLPVALAAAKEN